jgi:hypothetical protein
MEGYSSSEFFNLENKLGSVKFVCTIFVNALQEYMLTNNLHELDYNTVPNLKAMAEDVNNARQELLKECERISKGPSKWL